MEKCGSFQVEVFISLPESLEIVMKGIENDKTSFGITTVPAKISTEMILDQFFEKADIEFFQKQGICIYPDDIPFFTKGIQLGKYFV